MNAMIKEIEISDDFEEKNTLTPRFFHLKQFL